MIDIHSHILPIDHGSDSLNSTISMIQSARRQGITHMIATPHSEDWLRDPDQAYDTFFKMRTILESIFPDMGFSLGCEVLCEEEEMPRILEALADKKIPVINDKYVLVEFPKYISCEKLLACVTKLREASWVPIIAHAERYVYAAERYASANNQNMIPTLRQMGCLIQINIHSLESTWEPEEERKWASDLILSRDVTFLGTDCHKSIDCFRPPSVTQGMLWLKANCTPDYLKKITHKNAEKLLLRE